MKAFEELDEDEQLMVGVLAQSTENITKALDWAISLRHDRDRSINALRTKGWTIADLATLSGLSQPMIQRIGVKGGIKSVRTAVIR